MINVNVEYIGQPVFLNLPFYLHSVSFGISEHKLVLSRAESERL